jgi:tRNA(fMet)-specific endonuclease VapC
MVKFAAGGRGTLALKRILLDTSAYVAFKRGDPDVNAVLRRAPEIALCPTVLGELLGGFACGSHAARNRPRT